MVPRGPRFPNFHTHNPDAVAPNLRSETFWQETIKLGCENDAGMVTITKDLS